MLMEHATFLDSLEAVCFSKTIKFQLPIPINIFYLEPKNNKDPRRIYYKAAHIHHTILRITENNRNQETIQPPKKDKTRY